MDAGTHWTAWFCRKNETVYFNSFDVENIAEEIKELSGNKCIKGNIFRVESSNSMCGHFWIGFIDSMLACKKLTDFTSFFSPYDFEKNDSIILNYFKGEWNW